MHDDVHVVGDLVATCRHWWRSSGGPARCECGHARPRLDYNLNSSDHPDHRTPVISPAPRRWVAAWNLFWYIGYGSVFQPPNLTRRSTTSSGGHSFAYDDVMKNSWA